VLIFFTATVAAPILEEWLFRGVLQTWLVRREWGGHAAMAGALLMALVSTRWDRLEWSPTAPGLRALLHSAMPSLFVLFMVPGYLAARWLVTRSQDDQVTGWQGDKGTDEDPLSPAQEQRPSRAAVVGAVYGASLLFAAAHSFAWPTPIPLFFLGLLLGWLMYRTESLVAPDVLHALFNGLSCVLLLLQPWLPPPPKGNDTTSAVRRPALVSTSTIVPGSW
jgi:membrane protease YdiL (CAAX protease family)